MTGKKKKPVEDDPMQGYVRKRATLDQRVVNREITLDEVNLGLQAILNREFELTWKEGMDKKVEGEFRRRLTDLMWKIKSEVEKGEVEIMETEGIKVVATWSGFVQVLPEGFPDRRISLDDPSGTLTFHKPELRDLRKILRDLRSKKKAKATA